MTVVAAASTRFADDQIHVELWHRRDPQGGLCAPKTCPRDDFFLSKLMRLTCCRLGIGGSPYDGSLHVGPKDASKCEESFDCEYCTIGKDDIHSNWGKPGENFYFFCTPASGCAL